MDFLRSDKGKLCLRVGIAVLVVAILAAAVVVFRGDLIPGWHTENGKRYYLTFPLSRASGLVSIEGQDYMFSDYGENELLYGFNKWQGDRYYSDENGVIVKGECQIDGEWYCFDSETGILRQDVMVILNGALWYFNDHGYKQTGFVAMDGNLYYFKETGNLLKGLHVIDGKTYYFDPARECASFGLLSVDGNTYYFGEDGAAVTGEVEIDGFTYLFDESGKRIG